MTHMDISGNLIQHPLVSKAFLAAREWHKGQKRGTSFKSEVSAFSHALRVAEVLQQNVDYDPILIASGLLHDVIEDPTGATREIIADQISGDVASIVDEVSLDTSIKGKLRRDMQEAAIPGMSLNSRRLKVADRSVNLINLAFDPPQTWRLENKINYLLSSQKLLENADIPDLKLKTFAQEALQLAERAVLVGIREKILQDGPQFKGIEGDISPIVQKAMRDIELMPTLYDEEGKPVQQSSDLDEAYAEAPWAQREISTVVKHLGQAYGYTAILPNELKSRTRANEVVEGRMGGDARYLNDIARVAIVCKTLDEVDQAMHAISQSYKNVVIYDRFDNPPPTGYRDLRLVVRTDRSHFAEIQIHLESYWNAKKYKGDDIYHQLRKIGCGAGEELSTDDKRSRRKLYEESRALYKEAGTPHGFTDLKPGNCPPIRYDQYVVKSAERKLGDNFSPAPTLS